MHNRRRDRAVTRRALLAASGGGLLAGCLGGGDDSGATESTATASEQPATSSVTPSPTPAERDEFIRGTEGGSTAVNVTDHGATPDDETDDTKAIRDAFRAAASSGATVTFDPGVYRLQSDRFTGRRTPIPIDAPILPLAGYEDLTVEGDGATLSLAGRLVDGERHFGDTLTFYQCSNLTLRGLTLDWDRDHPHSAGTVVANTPEHFDLELNAPYRAREGLHAPWFLEYNTNLERFEANLNTQNRWEDSVVTVQSDRVIRVPKHPDNSDGLSEGMDAVVTHTNAAPTGLRVMGSDGVRVDGLTIHAMPGFAVRASDVTDLHVSNSSIVPRDVDGVWMASNRDGFHISDIRGEELRFEGIEVKNIADDAFNLKVDRGEPSIPDAKTVVYSIPLRNWWLTSPWREGDTMELGVPPNPATPDYTRTVANVEKTWNGDDGRVKLTLESALPQTVLGAETVSVIDASATPDAVTVRDARVKGIRGGNRFALDNTTVENCEFIDNSVNAIMVYLTRPEGEPIDGFTFRNNTLRRCTFNTNAGGGVITTWAYAYSGQNPVGFFKNHTYEGNSVQQIREGFPAIALSEIETVTVRNNDFSGITGTKPVSLGGNVDCGSITIDGTSGCDY
jgi:hypothetical protein